MKLSDTEMRDMLALMKRRIDEAMSGVTQFSNDPRECASLCREAAATALRCSRSFVMAAHIMEGRESSPKQAMGEVLLGIINPLMDEPLMSPHAEAVQNLKQRFKK